MHPAAAAAAPSQADALLLTASGDQTVGVWDAATAAATATCAGHQGSVKAVAGHPGQHDLLASGGCLGGVGGWVGAAGGSWSQRADGRTQPILAAQSSVRVAEGQAGCTCRWQGHVCAGAGEGPADSLPPACLRSSALTPAAAGCLLCVNCMLRPGGRDGRVLLWDLRRPGRSGRGGRTTLAPILQLQVRRGGGGGRV